MSREPYPADRIPFVQCAPYDSPCYGCVHESEYCAPECEECPDLLAYLDGVGE